MVVQVTGYYQQVDALRFMAELIKQIEKILTVIIGLVTYGRRDCFLYSGDDRGFSAFEGILPGGYVDIAQVAEGQFMFIRRRVRKWGAGSGWASLCRALVQPPYPSPSWHIRGHLFWHI
jgi:hypothetical protein